MLAKHVAALMGGWSAEREVSLRSGAACAAVAALSRISNSPRSIMVLLNRPIRIEGR